MFTRKDPRNQKKNVLQCLWKWIVLPRNSAFKTMVNSTCSTRIRQNPHTLPLSPVHKWTKFITLAPTGAWWFTQAEVKLPFIGGNLDSNHCKPTNIEKVAKMITDFMWPTKMMIDRSNLGQLISVHQGCTDSSASTNAPDGGHAHSSVLLYEGGWFFEVIVTLVSFPSLPPRASDPDARPSQRLGRLKDHVSPALPPKVVQGPQTWWRRTCQCRFARKLSLSSDRTAPTANLWPPLSGLKKQTNTLPVCRPHRQLHFSHLDVPARKSTTYNLGFLKRHHKNICIVNYIYIYIFYIPNIDTL